MLNNKLLYHIGLIITLCCNTVLFSHEEEIISPKEESYVVREAQPYPSDEKKVATILFDCKEEVAPHCTTLKEIKQIIKEARFREDIIKVIQYKKDIRGTIILMPYKKNNLNDKYSLEEIKGIYIARLAIDPSYQGKGLGKFFLRSILQEYHSKGTVEAKLWVNEDNIRAKKLYHSLGFTTSIQNGDYQSMRKPLFGVLHRPLLKQLAFRIINRCLKALI